MTKNIAESELMDDGLRPILKKWVLKKYKGRTSAKKKALAACVAKVTFYPKTLTIRENVFFRN